MHPAVSPAPRTTTPRGQPPRLRVTPTSVSNVGITYDSENYAMLNRPVETGRHSRRILRYLRPTSSDSLLEIGCGRGWLTQRMQELCPATYGIDVNPKSIAHGVAENLATMDAVDLRFEDEQFDHVYSFHAIEHIVDAGDAINEMQRVLVPGGRILLVYPAEPIRGLYAMPGAWIGFGNPFLARELHVHSFTPRRIRRLAEQCGLKHVESALDFFITPQFMTLLEKAPRMR
jgi:ubiquinone/menaquinone biosynthesis C-methylase UbiE